MIPEDMLELGESRLLEVDNRIILPINTLIEFLTTANDVLHSFAVPELSVKLDAVPGRYNSITICITRPGVFFGQCSELCGAYHGFMPIVIEAIDVNSFKN
jgi:heme/copper-type cytochrome/quinol oxidase subunit 2